MSDLETKIIFFGISDVGRHRENNEDRFIVADLTRKVIGVYDNTVTPDLICHKIGAFGTVFIVADGLGGHEKGEVASQIAVEGTVQFLFDMENESGCPAEWLNAAIQSAHSNIRKASNYSDSPKGMGSTITAIHVGQDVMTVAQVGDSRAYSFRDGKLKLLTEDQTLVGMLQKRGLLTDDQAQSHPSKHVILQALGQDKEVYAEIDSHQLRDNDYLLLCTDGLSSYVDHETIEKILSSSSDTPTHCQHLVDAANANGGLDNVTVVLARLATKH
ncbi:PP2C family protein-serine/threonine phosphatase [Candidatus Entotheonella palauensis]|nr:PP2C family serine/threonine-protein phosphatase [Candidatus Entotheonella palauensis]